ncbi:hypothetical protein [Burkholderia gladioli]|uniref:hypothetical protein n=1 Tax=Burkholderia gladioli TaxID=28095 RepID=UPI0019076DC6|nr:hypothetical protein [Burkholderia gladioli]MBJ9659156.1 hypothetical protein [Burkholderia gladioli]
MKHNQHQRTIAAIVFGTAILLSACSGKPSDGAYTDAVKAGLDRQSLCWKLPPVDGKFPSSIKASDYDMSNEAKKAAVRAGIVTLVQQGYDYTVALTPKGLAANAWDPKTGICVGHRELVGDVKFLPGGDRGDGTDMRVVEYSFGLTDVPQWVRDSALASQGLRDQNQGLDTPVKVQSLVMREKKDGPLLLEEN